MTTTTASTGNFSLRAYRGDAKTLLAFNLATKKSARNLAGFTILCAPDGVTPYYIQNDLRFTNPDQHAQDPQEPANSTLNAPIHKFRWVHVPGSVHQGLTPFHGTYTYTVTPRFFDANGSLMPLDQSSSASVTIIVAPFTKQGLTLGFTRGYVQSQAFVHHFGLDALIQPKKRDLVWDTSQTSGTNASGVTYTYADQYDWLGATARSIIFETLHSVLNDTTLRADMLCYDLNEPDVITIMLQLAKEGRIRVILDNAALHHSTSAPKPEDKFEQLFTAAATGAAELKRGKFSRYAHDKVIIVRDRTSGHAHKVLTGSTNFSVTGVYVNSNHVLVFNDAAVATTYAGMFDSAGNADVKTAAWLADAWAGKVYDFESTNTPKTSLTFSPHEPAFASDLLGGIATRIAQEGKKGKATGSVLFAVMAIDQGTSPVYTALNDVHKKQNIFSFGISDSPKGIYLYPMGRKTGVLVTGKPSKTDLPAPFDQVPNIGLGHQVHHKFVVCGFNTADAVVYCGSSNLAQGGEESNGDNLLAIHDQDIATAFAIEALLLVDHFNFLDSVAQNTKGAKVVPDTASKQQAAVRANWYLSTTDKWVQKYYDASDLHSVDRQLFA